MQLPEELQKFPMCNLLITADSATAIFYLVGGDNVEQIASVALPIEKKQDNEGSFASADGSRVAGPVDEDDSERLKRFVKKIADAAASVVRMHKITQICLVMPAEIEHALSEELPGDIKPLIHHKLHKDLMKETPVEIVKKMLDEGTTN